MHLKEKKEEKNNKLIEWGYKKLFNNVYCIYITNHSDKKTLLEKVEKINNIEIFPKIHLDIRVCTEFYTHYNDLNEEEEYVFRFCIANINELVTEEIDLLSECDFKKFVEMIDLINDTTTILKEEKEEVLNNLVTDNDIINKPNHYQINIKGNNIEVIDIIDEVVKDYKPQEAFKIANIIKYVLRASKKNGIEDLKKARKYIDILVGNNIENNSEIENQNSSYINDIIMYSKGYTLELRLPRTQIEDSLFREYADEEMIKELDSYLEYNKSVKILNTNYSYNTIKKLSRK